VCIRWYDLGDEDNYVSIISDNRRVAFVFRTIIIVTTLYLEMGNSIIMKRVPQLCTVIWVLFEYVIIFGPLYLTIEYGHFFYDIWYMRWNYHDYE
jgi:hypothetical protein